jgi:aldehyde dehydrogenase (NAD+)
MSDEPSIALAHASRLFINGEWVNPVTPARFDVLDSATEEVLVTVARAEKDDVDRAVAAAREAFDEGPWPRMTHRERARYLRELGAAFDARTAQVAESWTREVGLVHRMAMANAGGVGAIYAANADLAETFPFIEKHAPQIGNVGLLVREPVGVVAAIVPWNGPATSIAVKIAPALLAGCTVIVKLPPEAPIIGYMLAEACERIGFPPGVVNMLTAERDASERLVRHAGVDKIAFTGSTAAGRRIGAICGERVARCTLELGGKSAALILDDYDIEEAAERLAEMGCILTGQGCGLLTRVIVPRARHDAMVEALSAAYGSKTVGDPFDPDVQVGPLAMSRQRDKVEELIAKGIAEGATLATGGRRPPHLDRGYFIEPTVFGHVDNADTIAREEIFGPVLSVVPAADEQDAIRLANDSIYGLNGAVFTREADRAYNVARQVRTGTVGQNGLFYDFSIAFGGFKQSGVGREGGREGLLSFLEAKTIILDDQPTLGWSSTSDC